MALPLISFVVVLVLVLVFESTGRFVENENESRFAENENEFRGTDFVNRIRALVLIIG